jgi:CheY-like chemotaxis protein
MSESARRPRHGQEWRVLVAVGAVDRRRELARRLRERGCVVATVADGLSLSERLDETDEPDDTERVDLVIAELDLAGESGLSVLESMHSKGRQTPFFLIVDGNQSVARQAFALGVTRVFSEPVDHDVVVDAVQTYLLVNRPRPRPRRRVRLLH